MLGVAVRVYPSAGFKGMGYDENLYRIYVDQLRAAGLFRYPDITESYIQEQTALPSAILPPTRFLYIFCAYVWSAVFHEPSIASLRAVSCLFSILTLGLSARWSYRLGGRAMCLGTAALTACAPVQIHMAQHALIDGFFAFWAMFSLWALWECLTTPERQVWHFIYAVALAALVLTKENSFFICAALLSLVALSRPLRLGTVSPRLLLLTFAGPLLGFVTLLFLAGGVENFAAVYRLLVAKAYTLDYAIKNGDGPWHRYLVDLLLSSPLVFLLATGAAFRVRFADKTTLYLLVFVAVSYALMCNVRYSMNLRYATVWEMPLRYLAMSQLALCARAAGRGTRWALAAATSLLCLYDLRLYHLFFVEHSLYELVTSGLLQCLRILK